MNRTMILAAFATASLTSVADAAPIGAFSELEMSHSFVVNGGSVPSGIAISNSGLLDFSTDAISSVDDPTATTSETSSFQVGNPFATPPLPVLATRNNATQLPGGFEGAAAGYDLEIASEDDPTEGVNGIIRREVTQEGSASAILLDDTIAASATSFVRNARNFTFTNVSQTRTSFNIAGQFDAFLRAEYIGEDGIARAAGGFELEFVKINSAEVTYFPVSPYLTAIDDSSPGAFVSQILQTETGIDFDASVSATGSGDTTLATFEGSHRYVFGLTLDPNATILMRTSFTQANSVEHIPLPDIQAVPLPAGGLLLLSGVFGLATLGRRKKSIV